MEMTMPIDFADFFGEGVIELFSGGLDEEVWDITNQLKSLAIGKNIDFDDMNEAVAAEELGLAYDEEDNTFYDDQLNEYDVTLEMIEE